MGRPKRNVQAAAEESTTPPDELTAQQSVARVIKAEGNSLYSCILPDKTTVTVQLQDRFRNTIWIRRGGYVLVDLTPSQEHKGKVQGDIVNIVREEKEWRKKSYWPKEFAKASAYDADSDEEESTVGKMPPSDSESDD
ncbi:putative S1-like domain-containing protein [Microdochium bolleyi]|uniref:Putative S1-like domain-containing protein n=1 Tax=Microdochium bolleyi TaxID=196109 RepID=A0A136IKQ9_9PEZI|nr:putative S1-like domain-containing protein [Microdochium bolleyi]